MKRDLLDRWGDVFLSRRLERVAALFIAFFWGWLLGFVQFQLGR